VQYNETMSKWLAVAVVVVLVAGCNYGAGAFTCGPDKPCGGSGICEPGFNLCSFPDEAKCGAGGRSFGDLAGDKSGDCVGGKGSGDGGVDSPPEAQACFGTGLLHICLEAAPTAPLTIAALAVLNTDNSTMCAPVRSGGNYCVLAGTTITVDAKLRATGSRPLVLIASDSIMTGAAIDVGSHRGPPEETGAGADPAACAPGKAPTTANNTSGGGAGGSFTGLGGNGGDGGGAGGGAAGTPGAVAGTISELRGGCAGQDGQGTANGGKGHGGGAVFLIAGNKIDVQGGINAAGEGGAPGVTGSAGGGGGGAGGMIGFDAPMITVSGLLLANGGGGGEGSGTATLGAPGADPTGTAAAIGGKDNTTNGGDGGNGSAGAAAGSGAPGSNGANGTNPGGGGGGGGGAGLVKAPGTANLGSQVSPAATP
jgi:hypothetical protein